MIISLRTLEWLDVSVDVALMYSLNNKSINIHFDGEKKNEIESMCAAQVKTSNTDLPESLLFSSSCSFARSLAQWLMINKKWEWTFFWLDRTERKTFSFFFLQPREREKRENDEFSLARRRSARPMNIFISRSVTRREKISLSEECFSFAPKFDWSEKNSFFLFKKI